MTPARYSTVAIVLHWLIAALLLFEVGLGLRMGAAQGQAQFAIFQLHKSIGITILLLVGLRLVWRFIRKPPPIEARPWERALAHLVHGLFYLLLFALPISGWIIVSTSRIAVPTLLYGIVPWPHLPALDGLAAGAKQMWNDVATFLHHGFVKLLIGLFALHVTGALKHHFIDRQPGIAKMAPGTKAGAWADPRLILIAAGVLLAAGLGFRWLPIGATPTAARVVQAPRAPAPALPIPAAPAPEEATPIVKVEEAEKAELSSWAIGTASTIRFHTSWAGSAIDGGFARFEGDIVFGPDRLDRSKVEIRVDTTSVFSGDEQRDGTLRSADWFDTSSFAVATFRAVRFRKTGKDSYAARGTLGIKGITLPLTLPFTLRIDGDRATMKGSASVDRLAYKLGETSFATTDQIPAAVALDVEVAATRRPI